MYLASSWYELCTLIFTSLLWWGRVQRCKSKVARVHCTSLPCIQRCYGSYPEGRKRTIIIIPYQYTIASFTRAIQIRIQSNMDCSPPVKRGLSNPDSNPDWSCSHLPELGSNAGRIARVNRAYVIPDWSVRLIERWVNFVPITWMCATVWQVLGTLYIASLPQYSCTCL